MTLFGHHAAATGDAAFNVAVFRDFRARARTGLGRRPAPVAVGYCYGHWLARDGMRVDFVDADVLADLCDGSPETCFERDAIADCRRSTLFHPALLGAASCAGSTT